MAERRSYEKKLLDDMRTLKPYKWYNCPDKPKYDRFVSQVKIFIDCDEPFVFNEDYSRIKRYLYPGEKQELTTWHTMDKKDLPNGITIVPLLPGEKIIFEFKGKQIEHVREKKAWSILWNGIEFCVET